MNTISSWISSSFTKGLVSVIIPTFNREDLIKQSILSVNQQSYRPIECIIVDDGSSDNTLVLIDQMQRELNSETFKILLIEQPNSGAPSARNNGIKNASGEYFQFLDSDDILYTNKIGSHVASMNADKGIDGVYGDWNHGTTEDYVLIKGEKWKDTINQFYGGRVIHTLSFLFRRRIVEMIGPWDENLKRNQEVDFHLRGALVGGNFDYLPEVTGLWREHEGERIVTSNGAIKAIEFHEKWIKEFDKIGLLTPERKKTAAQYLFWYAMELDKKKKKQTIAYLVKASKLYPHFPEFNTPKMKILSKLFGLKLSINMWYSYINLRKDDD